MKVLVQSPTAVARAFSVLAANGDLWPNYRATIEATVYGLLIAVAIGTPIGLVLGSLPRVQRIVAPFLSAANAMPRIALAPVFIVAFGVDTGAKVALAFSLVVFIMVMNGIAGVAAADSEAVRMMTTLGASRRQTLLKVILPAALPSILAGIRLGLIYSLLGVIASELIASKDGLGQLIMRSSGIFDMSTVYAMLLLLMLTAALFNTLCETVERWVLRWKPPISR